MTTLSPSTADRTEIAGVMMLSPRNSAAPKTPSAASTAVVRALELEVQRRSRVIRAMMPPSPSLSTRIASNTYVTVTMSITDQNTSDTTPKTFSSVTGTGCGSSGLNTVCSV